MLQGRRSRPSASSAARERERAALVLRNGERLLGEDERAEPAAAAGSQRRRGAVEGQFLHGLDRRARDSLDLGERQRRGEQDARRGRPARDLADREKRLARQRVVRLERRRPPVRHQELAAPAARHGDAVGIGDASRRRGDAAAHPALAATFAQRAPGTPPSPARERGRG